MENLILSVQIYVFNTANTCVHFITANCIGFYCNWSYSYLLFQKKNTHEPKRSHNEAVGYIFAILSGFYGLLLGFVVFLVWDSLNSAQSDVSREGSAAIAFYRDINYFPDHEKIAPLKSVYMVYVHSVIDKEFPGMESMKAINRHHHDTFNHVFATMGKLDLGDVYSGQMFRQLNELSMYRSLRNLDASSSIPTEIWVPILLGGLIILVLAVMLDVERV
ncbi:bestrophin-like domain [Pedobacter sp. NJ-S-72]